MQQPKAATPAWPRVLRLPEGGESDAPSSYERSNRNGLILTRPPDGGGPQLELPGVEPAPARARIGATFVPALDGARLVGQQRRVYDVMADSAWRTLDELAGAIAVRWPGAHDMLPSLSARLRVLRQLGFTVLRRRRGLPAAGLFEYRLVTPEGEP
jgi:hypothetical protein